MMNKFLSVVLKESVLQAPFASKNKFMDPAVGAAVIGGAADLIGTLFGGSSTAQTNATNKQIAQMNVDMQRETNKQNYQMFKEQQQYALNQWNREAAWNEQMWNKNNEYNSPSALRQRLQAAGINPAAVFGSGSATPASQMSAPSGATPSGSPAVAPHNDYQQQPYFPDFTGIGDAVNAYFNNQLLSSQIKEKDVDTSIKQVQLQFSAYEKASELLEAKSRIAERLSNMKMSNSQREYYERLSSQIDGQIKLFNETFGELKERESIQNDVMKAQKTNLIADSTLKRSQAQYQSIISKYYPQMASAQLNVMSAQFNDLCESAALKVKTGRLTDEKSASQFISNQLQNIVLEQENTKHLNRTQRHKLLTELANFSDYLSSLVFQNLKLFR